MTALRSVPTRARRALAVGLLIGSCVAPACRGGESSTSRGTDPPVDREPTLELVFTYGSEKQNWIDESTASFNAERRRLASGKLVRVRAVPMGSGELIDDILAGRERPHLTSPASTAFIKLGNAQWRAKTGKDLVPATDNLVLSPVVIAMWKPMAEAIGWGTKPVGWADISGARRRPQGWAARGMRNGASSASVTRIRSSATAA